MGAYSNEYGMLNMTLFQDLQSLGLLYLSLGPPLLKLHLICVFAIHALMNLVPVNCEEYHIVNHNLNKIFVRSCNKTQGQLGENDDNDTDNTTDDFIVAGTTCVIAAGSGHELLWFVHIVDTATDVSSDKVGHAILPGQTYITGRYLEKKKEKKNGT